MAKYEIKDGVCVISKRTKAIADNAFRNCTELKQIEIPNSVTSIGSGAFQGCTGLISITIPDSVTEIGGGEVGLRPWVATVKGAFSGCTSLTSITIPKSVTVLGDLTFSGCTALKEIILPETLVKIGRYAFYGCTSLENIVIPASVKYFGHSIPQGAASNFQGNPFEECTALKSITMTEDLIKGIQIADGLYGTDDTRFYETIKALIIQQ